MKLLWGYNVSGGKGKCVVIQTRSKHTADRIQQHLTKILESGGTERPRQDFVTKSGMACNIYKSSFRCNQTEASANKNVRKRLPSTTDPIRRLATVP